MTEVLEEVCGRSHHLGLGGVLLVNGERAHHPLREPRGVLLHVGEKLLRNATLALAVANKQNLLRLCVCVCVRVLCVCVSLCVCA